MTCGVAEAFAGPNTRSPTVRACRPGWASSASPIATGSIWRRARQFAAGFLAEAGSDRPICLFCVEREPEACHRLLVAERLAGEGATVGHLLP